jgi:hypothetical protein
VESNVGDGFDFCVWYQGMIIDHIKAMTERKALNMARKIYGDEVTVSAVK